MHETCDLESPAHLTAPGASAHLGIIGGGQLAKMTALAALNLGCEVAVLERNPLSPGARLAPRSVVGDWDDAETLARFAAGADVITLENEFVDAGVLRGLEAAGHHVFPTAASIALTQDKLIQKQTLAGAGLAVADFRAVRSTTEVLAAARELGWPLVLKTRRNGYDGKGNHTLREAADVQPAWAKLDGDNCGMLVEAFFHFSQELAVIVTRGRRGETATYPVVETIQRDHVCHVVHAPAAVSPALSDRAGELARRAVAAVGGIGSFGVEMFLSEPGELVINELAPRVHNSGHYSIEACESSQFENHVRAVLGWPLGSTKMTAPAAAMLNLLGAGHASGRPQGLEAALAVSGAHVHLYGKAGCTPGRKMGHVTALGATRMEAWATAERAAQAIRFGAQL